MTESQSTRQRSDISDDLNHNTKKQKIQHQNHDDETAVNQTDVVQTDEYPEKLSLILSKLMDISAQIRSISDIQGIDDILQDLQDIKKKTPVIVVFGTQSSGKSTIIKKTFNFENKICQDIGTRIPCEIHLGPDYTVNRIRVQDSNNNILKETVLDSTTQKYAEAIKEIEDMLQEHNIIFSSVAGNHYLRIVCEINGPQAMTIVDLPGVISYHESDVARRHHNEYFKTVNDAYMSGPNVIVLHVVRGDTDPSNDASYDFVSKCKNRITVMTHIDAWERDVNKRACYTYHKAHAPYKTALTCGIIDASGQGVTDDHVKEICKEISIIQETDVIGYTELLKLVSEEFYARVRSSLPLIAERLKHVNAIFDRYFATIGGRARPNLRDVAERLRMHSSEMMKDISHDIEMNKELSRIRDQISPETIISFASRLPNAMVVADEIKHNNRDCVEGAEGWDGTIKIHISKMVNDLKRTTDAFVDRYMDVIEKHIYQRIDSLPASIYQAKKFAESIKGKLHDIIEKAKVAKKADINKFLDDFQKKPHTVITQKYLLPFDVMIIESVVTFLSKRTNRSEMIQNVAQDLSIITQAVAADMMTKGYTVYGRIAELALEHIKSIWVTQSTAVYTYIISTLYAEEKTIEKQIEQLLMNVDTECMMEDEQKESERQRLVTCENQINCLIELIE